MSEVSRLKRKYEPNNSEEDVIRGKILAGKDIEESIREKVLETVFQRNGKTCWPSEIARIIGRDEGILWRPLMPITHDACLDLAKQGWVKL